MTNALTLYVISFSDAHHRLWYYMNNQDKCSHHNNNHLSFRDASATPDASPSTSNGGEETKDFIQCDRQCSRHHIEVLENYSRRLPRRSCQFVDSRNQCSSHDKPRKAAGKDDSHSQIGAISNNLLTPNGPVALSDHSYSMKSTHKLRPVSTDTDVGREDVKVATRDRQR